jgi:glycogen debranching enzyme
MEADLKDLVAKARKILDDNWMGRYTRPSPLLYPHQWSWDSGFIAIGYSTFDQERAQAELTSLFDAQWKNGLVPHIIFNPEVTGEYFPGANFWKVSISENAPTNHKTSGITQPPVHATAVLRTFNRAPDKELCRRFIEKMYPKLLASHRFFYNERDPHGEGLMCVIHPWESGIDNSPTWDGPLKKMEIKDLPDYERHDLDKSVPIEQRPSDEDYSRYIYLVELFKKHNYDQLDILMESQFLIQDPLVNSILEKANQDLIEIGKLLGENTSEIEAWSEKTRPAMDKLWHDGHGIYDAYDYYAGEMIEVDTAAGFAPLYAGAASKSQAEKLYDYLDSNSFCSMHEKKCFSIPNYNIEGEHFDPANYWRGPIWININWMLFQGLRLYGYEDKAESVRTDIIELVKRYGFYEYFDPIKGRGYGSKDFSWTAALFLDAVHGDERHLDSKA